MHMQSFGNDTKAYFTSRSHTGACKDTVTLLCFLGMFGRMILEKFVRPDA